MRVPAESRTPLLPLTFFSASSLPFALPPVVARGFGWPRWHLGIEGVNSRLARWLANALVAEFQDGDGDRDGDRGEWAKGDLNFDAEKIRGWILLDYFDEPGGIAPLLVECNHRWRASP